MNFLLNLPVLEISAQQSKTFINIGIFALVFVVMYLLILRPQRKKQKETQEMLKNLNKGDKVTSIGGIKGTVHAVKEDGTVIVKVDDNTKLEFNKSAISGVDAPKNGTTSQSSEGKTGLFGRKKSDD